MNSQNLAIPVLMYHHVNPVGNFINVRPHNFEAHMRYLKGAGFTSLHTAEFSDILTGRQEAPKRPVMITFDDGWLDNWVFAFPLLKKYNMKAVIFLITSRIAEQGKRTRSDEAPVDPLPTHRDSGKLIQQGRTAEVMLSWDEVHEMMNSGLVEFHSHTHSHTRWDKLVLDRDKRNEALRKDLLAAKDIMEARLNMSDEALCWPQGFFDRDYLEIAESLGYRMMFTTKTGTNTPDTTMRKVRRLVIGDISTFSLRKKLFIHSRSWLSRAYLRLFK
jgi:peptidoglycan/xylan/chitin deacetylase (PgdA/CDA1 family)